MNWSISRLDCYPQYSGRSDVVCMAYWECTGTQGEHTASASGSCFLPPPSGDFVPYASLTAQQALDWCWANGISKADVESRVTQMLDRKANPPVVTPPLPWS